MYIHYSDLFDNEVHSSLTVQQNGYLLFPFLYCLIHNLIGNFLKYNIYLQLFLYNQVLRICWCKLALIFKILYTIHFIPCHTCRVLTILISNYSYVFVQSVICFCFDVSIKCNDLNDDLSVKNIHFHFHFLQNMIDCVTEWERYSFVNL